MIVRLIENLLDTDEDLTEDKIEEIFIKQIRSVKEKNANRANRIFGILDDRLMREEKSLNDLLSFMQKEV